LLTIFSTRFSTPAFTIPFFAGCAVFLAAPFLTTALFEVRTEEDARGFAAARFLARALAGGGDVFALAGVAIVRDFDAIFVPGVFIVRES
jgi:hypothetical protein